MTDTRRRRIPVNLISGPLGVGKTTTINHLLEHRPRGERWAVLVNEYGLVGLDAALMESAQAPSKAAGVEIREVAGGCICCSAGFMFEVSLVLLLQKRPDRLLIEPTGLAALSGILDTLDRPGIRESIDIRSIVCLLDPERVDKNSLPDQVLDQIEAADVLLASRSDLASAEGLESFHTWATSLFPPKRFVDQITHGRIPLKLLDLVTARDSFVSRGGHQHGTDHHNGHEHHDHDRHHDHDEISDRSTTAKSTVETTDMVNASQPIVNRSHRSPIASTAGWVLWEGLIFDAKRVSCWLNEVAQLPGARRTKAVLRTNEGWWGFNFADGVEEINPSGYRRDSRLEVVFDGESLPDAAALEETLRSCLISPREQEL